MNRLPILLILLATQAVSAVPQQRPTCMVANGVATLHNERLDLSFDISDGRLTLGRLDNHLSGTRLALNGEPFELSYTDGRVLKGTNFVLQEYLRCVAVPGDPGASRLAERRESTELRATLLGNGGALRVRWTARLGAGASYVRQTLLFDATSDQSIAGVTLISINLPGSTIAGTSDGVPVVHDDSYFAFEHPMARAFIAGDRATSTLRRRLPLRAGVEVAYSSIVGVTARGQLRRGFADYVENERAHPFRTHLHYNSWYDIGYFSRYSERDALDVIGWYGKELVHDRRVVLDSFLFDDGWDDTSRLWQFNGGFPQGFDRIRDAAAAVGAVPGLWLSPWGGYGPPRLERLSAATVAGFEVNDQGIALSGTHYYQYFHEAALGLVRHSGIRDFKLDGVGSPDKVTAGSAFDSDFAAAIALIDDLRVASPDVYINLTTNTWPSPFWLRTADSIWRGGEDHEFAGSGTNRARWITYRDGDTYGGIVRQSPLFPLNALMLHGIIYARHARGLDSDPAGDFPGEVWSYFASGTGLQELYVSPDLMTSETWNVLASAARWARAHKDVLRDSHWLGGDPARAEVYGWASWSNGSAVIALRNPSGHPQTYRLDLTAALELPEGALERFHTATKYGQRAPGLLDARRTTAITLGPYGVLVWDLTAVTPGPRRPLSRDGLQ